MLPARISEISAALIISDVLWLRPAGTETPNRTSSDCFFAGKAAEHPLLKEVEHRLQQLLRMPQICRGRKQLVQSEAIQVVRYLKGEFYQEHYDNKETPPGTPMKRSATAILYLNTTAEGGATFFPRASGNHVYLTVKPADAIVPNYMVMGFIDTTISVSSKQQGPAGR
ncbi:hypothetical protein CEUSTIGMA_g11198.t1 [Chlamydomonas eustigma]|uniref:Prolyl 4-hydroxylase alpha subunit Fe(2+) 2OG dioxygenase domain-containing protein n=1 Tax=Chlamydomonas eustigma TaxID=1157962 RepID=A0A250XL71_9CHLO|nr:hypothetical protein CEUSTIGMA_g11198.t1 [Chlamydomonas eustigma]|eukprot:GAX83773.1 hypothetical protein CEUSTIGMA_g11198.t1 [Chlamydomonas eustigma]